MSLFEARELSLFSKLNLVWSRLSPNWARKKIDSQLFLPNSHNRKKTRAPRGFEQKVIKTPDGEINAYMIGRGPAVVFVHSWGGGAYQFFSLMRGLKQCGFRAIAFDHLGHESSENKPSTPEQMIATTNFVLNLVKKQHREGLYGVVAHGLGCMVVANARQSLIADRALFLIAPIFNYRLYFLKKLSGLQLNADVVKQYAASFARTYDVRYAPMELARKLQKYHDYTVIAHDENDSVAPISESKKFCDKYPLTKLLATRQWDHNRLISSETVWAELKSHLNYEDTTINFANILREERNA